VAKKIKMPDYSQFNVAGYLDFLDPNKNPNLTEEFNQAWNESPATPANPAGPVVAAPTSVGVYQKREGQYMVTYERMSDGTNREITRDRERSAGDDVEAMFTAAGLDQGFVSQLVGIINGMYEQTVAPTQGQMLNAIYNSEPYKQRFSANEIIRQRLSGGKGRPGDRLLSPKEYIDLENTYRTIFQDAQMPTGFYDAPEDFNTLISNSISASESSPA